MKRVKRVFQRLLLVFVIATAGVSSTACDDFLNIECADATQEYNYLSAEHAIAQQAGNEERIIYTENQMGVEQSRMRDSCSLYLF